MVHYPIYGFHNQGDERKSWYVFWQRHSSKTPPLFSPPSFFRFANSSNFCQTSRERLGFCRHIPWNIDELGNFVLGISNVAQALKGWSLLNHLVAINLLNRHNQLSAEELRVKHLFAQFSFYASVTWLLAKCDSCLNYLTPNLPRHSGTRNTFGYQPWP